MDKNQARAYALMAFRKTNEKTENGFLLVLDMLFYGIGEDEVVALAYDGGHENEKKVELG